MHTEGTYTGVQSHSCRYLHAYTEHTRAHNPAYMSTHKEAQVHEHTCIQRKTCTSTQMWTDTHNYVCIYSSPRYKQTWIHTLCTRTEPHFLDPLPLLDRPESPDLSGESSLELVLGSLALGTLPCSFLCSLWLGSSLCPAPSGLILSGLEGTW